MNSQQIIALLGIAIFTLMAWLVSRDIRRINLRLLCWGFAFQLLFALFVFRTEIGQNLFGGINSVVIATVDAALEGPKFVFGSLGRCPRRSKFAWNPDDSDGGSGVLYAVATACFEFHRTAFGNDSCLRPVRICPSAVAGDFCRWSSGFGA